MEQLLFAQSSSFFQLDRSFDCIVTGTTNLKQSGYDKIFYNSNSSSKKEYTAFVQFPSFLLLLS